MNDVLESCAQFPEIVLQPGERLIVEGERGTAIYVLVDGTMDVWRGAYRVSRVREPGALFGEMSQLLGVPYSATVSAGTEARLRVAEDGMAFLASSPAVSLHAARLLAQRLQDATTYLADMKRQFEGEQGHLGLVDRILSSLLNEQRSAPAPVQANTDDPRL